MKGVQLCFYTYENRKHGNTLAYEWLLSFAKSFGIHGGSAFRAMAGFGRHGRRHEQHFFELAGDVPVLVEFVLTEEEASRFLEALEQECSGLFYSRWPVEFGVAGDQGG